MSKNYDLNLEDSASGFSIDADPELELVCTFFENQPDLETRVRNVIRRTLDETINSGRTGKYLVRHLEKTEKTAIGTAIEINFKKEFGLTKTKRFDANISGVDVDIKWQTSGTWQIANENIGEVCVLLTADDERGVFSFGVLRANEEYLNAKNQDLKRGIGKSHFKKIRMFAEDSLFDTNALLELRVGEAERLMSIAPGTHRIAEYFRGNIGKVVPRTLVELLAEQVDPTRRARDARRILKTEGILLLNGTNKVSRDLASEQGLSLGVGQWVALRSAAK